MKTATQTILSSVLVIVMCFALITGATFALFSDDSEVNIAVNAGNVEVVASANVIGAWSAKWENGQYTSDKTIRTSDDGKTFHFTNGGKAYMDEGNVILSNITPGDGVQVQVDITNKSTVDIQYIVTVASVQNNAFFQALNVKVTSDEAMEKEVTSKWTPANAVKSGESDELDPVYVNIELPTTAGNELKGEKCNIIVSVVAYQANANVDGSKYVNTQEQLDEVLANAEEGDNIKLGAGHFEMPSTISADGITISGKEGESVVDVKKGSTLTTISGNRVTLKDLTFKAAEADGTQSGVLYITGDDVTVENCTFDSTDTDYTSMSIRGGAKNVLIKDCDFIGGFRQIGNGYGAAGTIITIEGCTFSNGTYGVHFDEMGGATVKIIDCTIAAWCSFGNTGGGKVVFESTKFCNGNYNYLKPYVDTELIDCTFESDFEFCAGAAGITISFVRPNFLTSKVITDLIDENTAFTLVVDGEKTEWPLV